MKEKSQYLEAGKIVSTHGLKGEMRVVSWCDSPELFCEFDIFYLGKDKVECEVVSSKIQKNIVLLRLDGIKTIEQAQKMRDKVLYIKRDQLELPEGTYFFEDLIGLHVIDAKTNFEYGILNDIQRTGANDIYEVKNEERSIWIPAIPQVIVKTDLENNTLFISPMEGLFDA